MNLADLSIRRPTFITCIVIVMLAVGWFSLKRLGVDLFPNVTFPIVTVTTPYPGAGPEEIETLVSKPLEDEFSTLSGLKRLSSVNEEGVSVVIAEFTLETDVKYAEQQIRDRTGAAKRKLPNDIEEPVIRRIDPSDQAILILSVNAKLGAAELYDLVDETIKPKIEQVPQVGLVDILGGRKREIHVTLDREKLKQREVSASLVAQRLAAAGENIPAGKVDQGAQELVFRSVGQFRNLDDIQATVVNFFGSDVPVTVKDIGKVADTLADEKNRAFVNGQPALFLNVFRQSGANTIAVAEGVKARIAKLNEELKSRPGSPEIKVVRDGAVWIVANVDDVKESIILGVMLAVLVVYFFLANGRSTIITGLALPNSLIGSFILMAAAGFTVNIMTLLALSLAVGLLVDDAIVVRENIFRHIEMGKEPVKAAREGTAEVRLAVIATTLAVLAVFGPVGFLKGVVGQFFKEFALTICFAMMISLFDALTIAPMLSAYFAGRVEEEGRKKGIWYRTVGAAVRGFNRFQDKLENAYESLLQKVVRRPRLSIAVSVIIALGSCSTVSKVPKTFLPQQDAGEFTVDIDLPPGTSLDEMNKMATRMDEIIRKNKEVAISAMTVGSKDGASNVASTYVKLVPSKERKGVNTIQFKERLREQLKEIAVSNPKVKDFDAVGAGQRPFNINIVGTDQKQLEEIGLKLLEYAKQHKGLKDADVNFRTGKPEFQVKIDTRKADKLGISTVQLGSELRAQVEGVTPAKFREFGREYDIRVRLMPGQRNLKEAFNSVYVPNINQNLVRLSSVAEPVETRGASKINRQDRARYVQINGDIAPGGGLGDIMNDFARELTSGQHKLPPGLRFEFIGQAENFKELADSIVVAMGFGVLFLYLVLASLYESFVIPFTIMLALPLAFSGSFTALWMTGESLNIFSMIGSVMLLGVAAKNSILLVDYANQLVSQGVPRADAIIKAGHTRLRPILMTTFALIAGTIPLALGLNEASKQRTSMGVAVIGGLISSTLLTLIVVPAAYDSLARFQIWSKNLLARIFRPESARDAARRPLDSNGGKAKGGPSVEVETSV